VPELVVSVTCTWRLTDPPTTAVWLDNPIEVLVVRGVTVSVVLPLTPFRLADMVAVLAPVPVRMPPHSPVASPWLPMTAAAESELQVTRCVRSWLLPSLYEPVAVYWTVLPA